MCEGSLFPETTAEYDRACVLTRNALHIHVAQTAQHGVSNNGVKVLTPLDMLELMKCTFECNVMYL